MALTRTITVGAGHHRHRWVAAILDRYVGRDVPIRFALPGHDDSFIGHVHFDSYQIRGQRGALRLSVTVVDQRIIDCLTGGGRPVVAA